MQQHYKEVVMFSLLKSKNSKIIQAVLDSDNSTVSNLIKGIKDINFCFEYNGRDDWNLLCLAARYSSFEILKSILDAGADIT
jgi:hypothetical protein